MKRLLAWVPLVMLLVAPVRAEVTVPVTEDLSVEAGLARERQLPLLLMFYAEHCAYCTIVEEDFLEPMLISGEYIDKAIIRRIDLERLRPIIDFDNRPISVSDFASRYGVFVTPTLVYVNAEGRELANKMVGLTTPDFYGGYIDGRIDSALEKLRGQPTRAAARE